MLSPAVSSKKINKHQSSTKKIEKSDSTKKVLFSDSLKRSTDFNEYISIYNGVEKPVIVDFSTMIDRSHPQQCATYKESINQILTGFQSLKESAQLKNMALIREDNKKDETYNSNWNVENLLLKIKLQSEDLLLQKVELNKKIDKFNKSREKLKEEQKKMKEFKKRFEDSLVVYSQAEKFYEEVQLKMKSIELAEINCQTREKELQAKLDQFIKEVKQFEEQKVLHCELISKKEAELDERERNFLLEQNEAIELKLAGLKINEELWEKKKEAEIRNIELELNKLKDFEEQLKQRELKIKNFESRNLASSSTKKLPSPINAHKIGICTEISPKKGNKGSDKKIIDNSFYLLKENNY